MSIVYFDAATTEQQQRQRLFEGRLYVYSPLASVLALCHFARELTEKAFGHVHPTQAQHHYAPAEYARILEQLKREFINHPHSLRLTHGILQELGWDMDKTYFDLPRMRTATSNGYLTTGIAYSFDPHRDTWFSAPLSQLNWWTPMYDIEAENCLTFYPKYWQKPIRNESVDYDCRRWLAETRRLKELGLVDERKRPRPLDDMRGCEELRLVCQVGGLILFSGAHLHGTVPNTTDVTRFSLDFRTVHLDDVVARTGAPNLDTQSTGTLLGDFRHPRTAEKVSDSLLELYAQGTPLHAPKPARRSPRAAPAAPRQRGGRRGSYSASEL